MKINVKFMALDNSCNKIWPRNNKEGLHKCLEKTPHKLKRALQNFLLSTSDESRAEQSGRRQEKMWLRGESVKCLLKQSAYNERKGRVKFSYLFSYISQCVVAI